MRRGLALIALAALAACVLAPGAAFTEDAATVKLARVIYALGRDEGYATKLALGTVVMNRVASPWYADTLDGVLDEQHQFPAGRRYDAESLSAAHDVLAGRRTLPGTALEYQSVRATWTRPDAPLAEVGGYRFYPGGAAL